MPCETGRNTKSTERCTSERSFTLFHPRMLSCPEASWGPQSALRRQRSLYGFTVSSLLMSKVKKRSHFVSLKPDVSGVSICTFIPFFLLSVHRSAHSSAFHLRGGPVGRPHRVSSPSPKTESGGGCDRGGGPGETDRREYFCLEP